MLRQAGVRKIDTMTIEGEPFDIYCDLNSGEFRIEVDHEVFRGKSLPNVKAKAVVRITERNGGQWKPVILVRGREFYSDEREECELMLSYNRMFRAVQANSENVYWKPWYCTSKDGASVGNDEDCVTGTPGPDCCRTPMDLGSSTVLDYTPEKWLALRSISKAMRELNLRIGEMIKPNRCEAFLAGVAHGDSLRLLMPPKKPAHKTE
jgi:hypothetical protein